MTINKQAVRDIVGALKDSGSYSPIKYVLCERHRILYHPKDGFFSHYKAEWPKRMREWTGIESLNDVVVSTGNKKAKKSVRRMLDEGATNQQIARALERTFL